MPAWKRLLLFPALFLTTLVASSWDWEIAIGTAGVLSVVQFFKSKGAVGYLDLFDRSTVAFGVAAGLPLGFNFAELIAAGETISEAVFHALLSPAGAVLLMMLAASFWVRAQLIRQSLCKGYLP
jgi:hypothetical protein